jgi:hypothetical protein
MTSTQLDLFGKAGVKVGVERPEPPTKVRLGNRQAQVSLHRQRREALEKFGILLDQLQGKTVWLGTYGGSGSHFWMDNLKLENLQTEKFGDPPGVIVLRGRRFASVRIFTDQVVNLREREYQGYTLWLLDFWNGFGEYPINPYRPKGYVSLDIVRFKE